MSIFMPSRPVHRLCETCACGATLNVQSHRYDAIWMQAQEFRDAHRLCRQGRGDYEPLEPIMDET